MKFPHSLIVCLVLTLALFAGVLTASDAKPRLTLDEFFNAVDFSGVRLSPDGHMVVIATSRADWKAQRFREDLWLWRDSDGLLIPLTQSGHDSDPKWSPDGKWIAFLSDRDNDSDDSDKDDDDDKTSKKGTVHLYLIPVNGGEAFPVTRGAEDVHAFAWSPDARALYFSTRQPLTSDQKDEQKEHWKDVERYREQERGDIVSRIAVAEALKRQIELGTQEPPKKSKKDKKKEKDEETGETPGALRLEWSPYRISSLAVSPDGEQLAYSTESVSQRFESLKEVEIWVSPGFNRQDHAAFRLTNNEALEGDLAFSSDGKSIFFDVESGSVEEKYADLQPRVYSVDFATGKPTRWAADFNGAVAHYALASNGSLLA